MNQSSDIFVEFSTKIRRVLECPEPGVVLSALRDLAEGRAASISGTVIDSLSGLRQQISGNVSNSSYRETMTTLLIWGMRNFVILPSLKGKHLWTSMSTLDGPRGYDQRLFASGIYFGDTRVEPCLPLEGGLFRPSIPIPRIIMKADQQPVKSFNVDLPYVVDYLRQEANARVVIATSSTFGWENLYVKCVCLYVDTDTTQSLAESAAVQPVLTIIMKGELRHATANTEAATKLLEPSGLGRSKQSAREWELKKNQDKAKRVIHNIGPFVHGQSISLLGVETKGSVAVFLSPEDEAENQVYALTAYHVVPLSAKENRVITPGRLDILSRLLKIIDRPTNDEELGFFLERRDKECGEVRYGIIGTNTHGWRSDWALVCLRDEWKGVNGSWMDNREMRLAYTTTIAESDAPETTFTGSSGIITCDDAMAGIICCKDGASTGCTSGRVGETEALMFKKGTAEAITEEEIQEQKIPLGEVDCARLVTVHPIDDKEGVVLPGDSGCGVFRPVPEEDGWSWVGQFVSIFYVEDGGSLGLMVPQSEIFRSLQEVTGKSWRLSVKNT